MKQRRVRVPWLLSALVVSLILIGCGLQADSWSRSSWSNALIALGAATLLLAVGIVVEPLFLRHIGQETEETATKAAESIVKDLRQRIIRLEDLDSQQASRRADRTEQVEKLLAELQEDVSIETVGRALAKAHDYGLFNNGYFRVRTSREIQAPELFFFPLMNRDNVALMWMSFLPMTARVPMHVGEGRLDVPAASDGTILWSPEMHADEIADELELELMRINLPMASEFSLAYAVNQLIESIRAMLRSRMAASNSESALEGRLTVLINEDWVITDQGLEATNARLVLSTDNPQAHLETETCPPNTTQPKWDEAVQYSQRYYQQWLAAIQFGQWT